MTTESSQPIQNTLRHLQDLDAKIKEGVFFDLETVAAIAGQLKTDSHNMSREHAKEVKLHEVTPLDADTRNQLLALIKSIENSPDFITTLGNQQTKLLGTLHEIRDHIKDWKSKVERVDN